MTTIRYIAPSKEPPARFYLVIPGVSRRLQQREDLPTLTHHSSQGVILINNRAGGNAPIIAQKVVEEFLKT